MDVLTITEAAQLIGCSVSQMRVWKRKGEGPKYFQKGKLIRYHLSNLEQFVDVNSTPNNGGDKKK